MELEDSTYLTSGYTTKPQLSRQYELALNFVNVMESFDTMMTATAGINIRVYKAHPLKTVTMISNDS